MLNLTACLRGAIVGLLQIKAAEKAAAAMPKKINLTAAPIRQYLVSHEHYERCEANGGHAAALAARWWMRGKPALPAQYACNLSCLQGSRLACKCMQV